MYRHLILLFLVLLFLVPTLLFSQTRAIRPVNLQIPNGEQIELYKGSYALVIGVSDYQDNAWADLSSVSQDVNAVSEALQGHGFEVTQVLNPTESDLIAAMDDFIDNHGYDKDNRLLIYYSGHGHTIERNGRKFGYLVPVDAPSPIDNEKDFFRRAIKMERILSWAKQIESKHALFLFDSCFSGSVLESRAITIPEDISYSTSKPVRQFISAGSANQTVPAVSVFRPTFIRGINGDADLDKDGYVTGVELGMYLQKRVPYYQSGQTPQYGKIRDPYLDEGNFVFEVGQSKREILVNTSAENQEVVPIKISEIRSELRQHFSNFISYNKHIYGISRFKENWDYMISNIDLFGGSPITINDDIENKIISDYYSKFNFNEAVIGYNDLEIEGEWRWYSGLNSNYKNWGVNEPNNSYHNYYASDEDITVMYLSNHRLDVGFDIGIWNDETKNAKWHYIFEWEDNILLKNQKIQNSKPTDRENPIFEEEPKFMAIGRDGTIISSENGFDWRSINSGTKLNFVDIVFGKNKFVAIGNRGMIYVIEGNTWKEIDLKTDLYLMGITFDGQKFIVVGNKGLLITSEDGENWTSVKTGIENLGWSSELWDIATGKNRFVATGRNGTIIYSENGKKWEKVNSGVYSEVLHGIAFGNNKFVVVGENGTVLASSDGKNWSKNPPPTGAKLTDVILTEISF